jgi:hypothetical protein
VGDTIQNCATLTATGVTTKNACNNFILIAGQSISLQVPPSTRQGSSVPVSVTLSGGAPTGTVTVRRFAASDTTCAAPLASGDINVDGAGTYAGPTINAIAGAYKWVATYNGDANHASATTGCDNPAGAFVVLAPPSLSASFGVPSIALGDSTALTFTITNPAANTVGLTGVALDNTVPAGLTVASPNGLTGSCGAGTITAAPGSQNVSLAGGTIPTGSSCTFTVKVTGAAPGDLTNTTGAVESANGGNGNTATAALTVQPPPPPVPPETTPVPQPNPPVAATPRTAQELAVSCSFANLVLSAERRSRGRVRFRGAGGPTDAGQQVLIRALPGRTIAARATVRPDGSFKAMGPLPRPRLLHRTRYYAELGARRSPALRLTRRLTARLTQTAGAITIRGHATPPLSKPIRRVVITRLTSCAGGYQVVARVKPNQHPVPPHPPAREHGTGALPRPDAAPHQGRRHDSDPQPRPASGIGGSAAHDAGVPPPVMRAEPAAGPPPQVDRRRADRERCMPAWIAVMDGAAACAHGEAARGRASVAAAARLAASRPVRDGDFDPAVLGAA